MCLLVHKWSQWEQYLEERSETPIGFIFPKEVRGKTFDVEEQRQRRRCLRCGKMQDVAIRQQ